METLLDILTLGARMRREGDLRSDDFAARLVHFLATSPEAMSNKLERDHSSFLECVAENVKITAGTELSHDEWRHMKHILSHGGRQEGTFAANDAMPFMASEGVEISPDKSSSDNSAPNSSAAPAPVEARSEEPKVLTTRAEVVDHMQRHFLNVANGHRVCAQAVVRECNDLPDPFADLQQRMAEDIPTPIDPDHLMKAMKRSKAAGLDVFPTDLYRLPPSYWPALSVPPWRR